MSGLACTKKIVDDGLWWLCSAPAVDTPDGPRCERHDLRRLPQLLDPARWTGRTVHVVAENGAVAQNVRLRAYDRATDTASVSYPTGSGWQSATVQVPASRLRASRKLAREMERAKKSSFGG